MSDSEIKDELSSDTSYDKGLKNENAQADESMFQQKENTAFTEVTAEKKENVPPDRVSCRSDVQNHPLLNSLVNTLKIIELCIV